MRLKVVDLERLRKYVGAASTSDDDLLTEALDASTAWVAGRVYPTSIGTADVDQATVMLAARLYRRRQSTEGASGFGGEGVVVRIISNDPDINRLLERHQDLSDAETGLGIG